MFKFNMLFEQFIREGVCLYQNIMLLNFIEKKYLDLDLDPAVFNNNF